jgi:hypothetical protein
LLTTNDWAQLYAQRPWMATIGYSSVAMAGGNSKLRAPPDTEVWIVYAEKTSTDLSRWYLNGGTMDGKPTWSKSGHALYTAEQAAALALLLGCNVLRIA